MAINYVENRAAAEAVADEARSLGAAASAVFQADVSQVAQAQELVERTVVAFGGIDVLVNNAGVSVTREPFLDMREESWDRVLGVDLKGAVFCAQGAARHMVGRRRGWIINISSTSGISYSRWQGVHYHGAKAAINHATLAMAIELGPYNVNVNAIVPGFTAGYRTEEHFRYPERREAALSQIPLGRIAEPDDIAAAAVFLASPGAWNITGQLIVINGGAVAYIRDYVFPDEGLHRPRSSEGPARGEDVSGGLT